MFRFTKMFSISIFLSLSILSAHQSHAVERVLYYDTFEEYDTRDGGFILPDGVERSRTSGRLFFTEREIEAPSAFGETQALARYIADPSGLSLAALLLQDDDDDIGDGSLGADGSVSLWESIILDQGDHSGRAVISWMAVPYQSSETGGTMFPETDSRIDAGPEGINLVGFGGVTREFDTGNPIPGQDFSEQIIINREGAVLTDTGVGYEANVPTFFILDFDLDSSTYNLIINGVVVEEGLPFFDVQGETGKTLRELELISNARGVGTFVYDNLFQIDPDHEFSPVPFRTPVVADQAELIPLFMESFDDEEPGFFVEEDTGDLYGSSFEVEGVLESLEDTTWQSPARGRLGTESSLTIHPAPLQDNNDQIRIALSFIPTAGSTLEVAAGNTTFTGFSVVDGIANYQDAINDEVLTGDAIYEDLPHWVTITLDTQSGLYFTKLYRATAPDNAQTAVIETQGVLPVTDFSTIKLTADDNDIYLDDILVVEINETPEGESGNHQQALLNHTYNLRQLDNIQTQDPTHWSFTATNLQNEADQTLHLINNQSISGSVRFAWTAIPGENTNGNSGVLVLELADGSQHVITGLINNTVGISDESEALVQPDDVTVDAPAGSRINFVVVVDLNLGFYEVYANGEEIDRDTFGDNPQKVTLTTALLTTPSDTTFGNSQLLIDDILVVNNHYAASFESTEFITPNTTNGINILFEEDFENNPARSELQVSDFDPRSSGLPIPTRSSGFSDLAETDILGTRLMTGAPSADAAYIEDPDGSSLYSLFIGDRFAPQEFAGFNSALPFTPISTLRTTPYAFVVPQIVAPAQQRYITIRWSGTAAQDDQAGLALFTSVEDVEVPAGSGSVTIPSPNNAPIVAFGDDSTIWLNLDGDGALETSGIPYQAENTYRFIVHIDTQTGTYDVSINEETVADDVPFSGEIDTRFGWFTTLVNNGNGVELQQSTVGGGKFVIDDIRVYESSEFTSIEQYKLYE